MRLIPLTAELLLTTRSAWIDALTQVSEHELFMTEYQQLFDVVEGCGGIVHLDERYNKPIYYAVIDDFDCVWALIEIVQSRKGQSVWVKMMDIFLSPQIDVLPESEDSTAKRLDIFSSALVGIFMLTKSIRKADTVKIYGRTDALVGFLKGMHDSFSVIASLGTLKGINVGIEGRWLVFRTIDS